MAEARKRRVLDRAVEGIAAAMLAVMVVLVFGNVVLRYGFNSGIPGAEELSRFIFVWLVFMGSVLAARRREHLGMDSFRNLFGPGGRRFLDILSEVIVAILSALFLWGAIRIARVTADNALPITGLPMWSVYAAGIVSAGGILIVTIIHLVQHLAGREPEVEHPEHLFRE
jgi:TRAP-type C4-dicarboxylate transport system permease small subunit